MTITISERTQQIYNQALICDMALGFEPEVEVSYKWNILTRYQNAGFTFLGLAIAGEFTGFEKTIHYLAKHKAHLSQDNNFIIVNKAEDILRAQQENKLAVGLWLQGSKPLGGDLNMIDIYYQLGIRYMLLCYNTKNFIGDGCVETSNNGLTKLGKKIIAAMNKVGMLIDCSHGGFKTTMEIMETSKDPVIFSHSNAYAIHNHPRNLKDEQIKALAKNGGVIGMNGLAMLLGTENNSSEKIVEHIDYISHLVGPQHIALGIDLVYFQEILDNFFAQASPTTYPSTYVTSQNLNGLQPENLIEVVEQLLQRNYKETEIIGILGENFLNVAKKVWR